MSGLVRELYRRYVADAARQDFGRSLGTLRKEASGTPAARLTMRQVDAEIRAARRARSRNGKPVR